MPGEFGQGLRPVRAVAVVNCQELVAKFWKCLGSFAMSCFLHTFSQKIRLIRNQFVVKTLLLPFAMYAVPLPTTFFRLRERGFN